MLLCDSPPKQLALESYLKWISVVARLLESLPSMREALASSSSTRGNRR